MRNESLLIVLLSILFSIGGTEIYGQVAKTSPSNKIYEDIDASDILLAIRFDYIEGDNVASEKLKKDQEAFLKSMGLPTSGQDEITEHKVLNFDKLDADYDLMKQKLRTHKYLQLFRQVCSQVLIKHFCAVNREDKFSISSKGRGLLYYLEEMKSSNGITIGLIYTSFLKLSKYNRPMQACPYFKPYLDYFDSVIKEKRRDKNSFSASADPSDQFDSFILSQMTRDIETSEEFKVKVTKLRTVSCELR